MSNSRDAHTETVLMSAGHGALALGYEGPMPAGDVAVAVAVLLGTLLLTVLVIRWLVTWASRDARPHGRRSAR